METGENQGETTNGSPLKKDLTKGHLLLPSEEIDHAQTKVHLGGGQTNNETEETKIRRQQGITALKESLPKKTG